MLFIMSGGNALGGKYLGELLLTSTTSIITSTSNSSNSNKSVLYDYLCLMSKYNPKVSGIIYRWTYKQITLYIYIKLN